MIHMRPPSLLPLMKGKTLEEWEKLCQLAAVEQDPERLMAIIQEIDRLLSEKEQRLKRQRAAKAS
jgi:hypothetical protein